MPFVIGTAGHIDHGKTALVKALTGQDTDRLKEEKERGISIDLGFAHLDLPDGTRVGVVDVPGHERFIRNMLAGAHGLDLVLFTVAADDGVMPQTEEHLDIVHLLGVQRGIVVVTKVDLVPDARLREVEEEIAILTSGSALEEAPVVRVSSVTGQGLDELRSHISRILQRAPTRPAHGHFRLPVDRAFLLQGHGLVVTGTALSGEVHVGDRVRCLPGDHIFRVRSLQVHNEPTETAQQGQRVALNLSGAETPSIERGHVICHDAISTPSDRFDAFLDVRPNAVAGVKSHQRVRVHLGTAERLGTIIVLGPHDTIGHKESAFCQIALAEPLLALRGDRFIIRDETAQRTVGGGVVIHPWARKHKRAEPGLLDRLERLHAGTLADVLGVFVEESATFALPLGPLVQFVNRAEADVRDQLGRMENIRSLDLDGETRYSTAAKWQRVRETLLAALRAFHGAHPLSPGMEMEEVRDTLPGSLEPRVFRAVVDRLAGDKVLVRDGSLLRLLTHTVQLKNDEQALVEKIKELLAKTPLSPPDVKQLAANTGAGAAKLGEVLRVMEREKTIVRVSPELYFLRDATDTVKATLRQRLPSKSDVTPATFRNLFDTSRKYAIPLLEFLDREGVTIRTGDTRRMR